ncbi:MAG: acyl-CoA thioesterase [Bacteroidales bacterium]|nr:acyl-CoA thioesterase [Bacteroidales bacterium]
MNLYDDLVWHHQMPAQLRFSDVDRFGHMNNAVYFSIFDTFKMQYFREAIGNEFFHKYAIVMANLQADYLSPIYFPDEIAIQTAIIHLGNKSFTMIQRAINTRTKDIKCVCKSIMVTYDINENHSVAMPQEYKQRIMEFESNPGLCDK